MNITIDHQLQEEIAEQQKMLAKILRETPLLGISITGKKCKEQAIFDEWMEAKKQKVVPEKPLK